MKRYIPHITLAIIIIALAVVIGCKYPNKEDSVVSNNSVETAEPVVTAMPEPTTTVEPTAEPIEVPHEHVYEEEITTDATCETEGLKTFICECGDTYTEVISAKGHRFTKYVYNEDATYLADGTMTSTCERCDSTKTSTAINTQLKYTFTLINDTMYAQQSVNVRDLPCVEGEKVGSLSTNEEVWVFTQCVETGWYEIVGDSISGYVSNNYLGTEKVVVQQENTSDSPYISDRNGYKVGDTATLDTGVSLVYQGNDIWLDTSSNTTYIVTQDLGGGRMWFEPQVSNTELEDTTPSNPTHYADDCGYKVGDKVSGTSEGQPLTLEYLGNDEWIDDYGNIWMSFDNGNGGIRWWKWN